MGLLRTWTIFSKTAWEQYNYWQNENLKTTQRINEIIRSIQRTPFQGLGKPEPLKHHFKGYWSRRITAEHRLTYRIVGGSGQNQRIEILTCQYH